jgi:hypothetical protein
MTPQMQKGNVMTGAKLLRDVRPEAKAENHATKLKAREGPASASALFGDDRGQMDEWFIGFGAKEGILVPRNAMPRPLLHVLRNPISTPVRADKMAYDRSKFLLTGLHAGDESRVEIALLTEGGGGGFADVMPGRGGFLITVPELSEFEEKAFTADEFLQAIHAAKAQFQIRADPIARNASGSNTKKP